MAQASEKSTSQALNPASWEEVTVVKKEKVNHDTVFVRLAFKDSSAVSGLTTASCLLLKAPIGSETEDGTKKDVIRPYTPISDPDARGYFDLVVKVYEQGNMSKHVGECSKGDSILCKGPIKKLPYEPNMKKKIGMIAGGSGITPMLQVIDAILQDPSDKTEVFLVFANKTPADILLKDKLDALAGKHSNFSVHYVVEKQGMMGLVSAFSTGYVTKDTVKKHLPPPGDDNLILVCGPPPMMKAISGDKAPDKSQGELTGMLAELGYSSDQVYKF